MRSQGYRLQNNTDTQLPGARHDKELSDQRGSRANLAVCLRKVDQVRAASGWQTLCKVSAGLNAHLVACASSTHTMQDFKSEDIGTAESNGGLTHNGQVSHGFSLCLSTDTLKWK